jgi:hypothetical protein
VSSAKERDELAPLHLITSSPPPGTASSSSSRTFAVLRLMTGGILVDADHHAMEAPIGSARADGQIVTIDDRG